MVLILGRYIHLDLSPPFWYHHPEEIHEECYEEERWCEEEDLMEEEVEMMVEVEESCYQMGVENDHYEKI